MNEEKARCRIGVRNFPVGLRRRTHACLLRGLVQLLSVDQAHDSRSEKLQTQLAGTLRKNHSASTARCGLRQRSHTNQGQKPLEPPGDRSSGQLQAMAWAEAAVVPLRQKGFAPEAIGDTPRALGVLPGLCPALVLPTSTDFDFRTISLIR